MDIRMPVLDGLAATERLRKLPERQRPRVLVVTTFELDEYVYGALRSGAAGFLLKDTPAEALADAVRTIAAGEALLGPTITRRLIEEYVARPAPGAAPPPALALLTERETDVLRALARGLSNAETGRQLFLSEATIKTHVTRILAKLGQRDRLQAVVFAYESGLVQPGEREPSL